MRTLPLLDELEAALASGTNARRIEMLTRITDLFVGGAPRLSEDQIGVFDDVMVRLVTTIEAKARAKLSHRLAPIAQRAHHTSSTCSPSTTTSRSRARAQPDRNGSASASLLANAASKSQQHLAAIAQRKSLDRSGDRRAGRTRRPRRRAIGGQELGRPLLRCRLPHALVKRSTGDDVLATEVGRRRDIPRPHFLLLLEKASSAVRARLAAENPPASAAVEGVVAEVVGGIRNDVRNASPDFAAAQAAVERQNRIRRIGEAEIYQYARDRKFEETAIALSLLCDTPIDVVERALLDPGAEIVLILAKVAGLSSTTTKAILLLRAADRGMSANDLDRALASFNRLQPETATPRARLLPHAREKAGGAHGPAGRRRQRMNLCFPGATQHEGVSCSPGSLRTPSLVVSRISAAAPRAAPHPGNKLSIAAIARVKRRRPGAVRIAIIAGAAPPIITVRPRLRLGGDDRRRSCRR